MTNLLLPRGESNYHCINHDADMKREILSFYIILFFFKNIFFEVIYFILFLRWLQMNRRPIISLLASAVMNHLLAADVLVLLRSHSPAQVCFLSET